MKIVVKSKLFSYKNFYSLILKQSTFSVHSLALKMSKLEQLKEFQIEPSLYMQSRTSHWANTLTPVPSTECT